MTTPLQIAKRFNGPPNSGNGGYTAGLIASKLAYDAEITLRTPPPLEEIMELKIEAASAKLMHGETIVAEAKVTDFQLTILPVVPWAEVETAAQKPKTFDAAIFADCFVCGSARQHGDGLCIYPGNVGSQQVAGAWIPHQNIGDDEGHVKKEFIWSALDCPGAWAIQNASRLVLLGRMAVKEVMPVKIGKPHIVMGWVIKEDGRKILTGTSIYTKSGEICAFAKATWISIKN